MEDILTNICIFIEYISFFYVFFRRNFRKKTRYFAVIIYGLLIMGGLFVSSDLCKIKTIGPLSVFMILVLIFLWETFDVSISEIIVWGIAQWLILTLIELVFFMIMYSFVKERSIVANVISLLITALCWLIYVITRNRVNVFNLKLPIRMWCIIDGILFVLTIMMVLFLVVLQSQVANVRAVRFGSAVLEIGTVAICILLFWFLYSYNNICELKIKNEVTEKISAQQRKYFEQLLSKEEETRRFRHDIMNDLLQIRHFCELGKYEELEHYLSNSLGIITDISQKNYDVGNDIVNVILNYYLMPMRDKCMIEVRGCMPAKLSIEDRELCILMANIVKNASEAVEKDGYISVKVSTGEQYISIDVENSIDGDVVVDKNGMPVTSKTDKKNHGFGVINIADVVKKNGGQYSFAAENGKFTTRVFLKYDRLRVKNAVGE